MNRQDLLIELQRAGVDPESYSVFQGLRTERYCIEESRTGFAVFYSERGKRNCEREFATESEACGYFLSWVLGDETVYRHD